MNAPPTISAPPVPPDLGGWLHDLSPYVVRISGDFGIRWYGMAYIAGFILAYYFLRNLSRSRFTPIPQERALDAILLLVVGVLVGGRLGYVLLYQPSLLTEFTSDPPWWGLLAINNGGMASHGAIIGLVIAAWRISRGFKTPEGSLEGRCPPMHVMDLLPMLGMAGYVLGRLANFVNGELLGRIVSAPGEHAPWWAVRFPQEVLTNHAPKLSDVQQARLDLLVRDHALPDDSYAQAYGRVMEAVIRGSSTVQTRLEPLLSARHPSQLYQALEGLIVLVIVWAIAARPRKPGVIGCAFLISYGVLRITTEFWRLPDDHLKTQVVLGLSRGQWLSAAMVLAGVVILTRILRSDATPMGGWRRAKGSGAAQSS
jgi:phosphatidylglycerol:prolipoprotein diacylglycerol transferase